MCFTNCALWFSTVKNYIFPKFPFFLFFPHLIFFPISRPFDFFPMAGGNSIIYRPENIWKELHQIYWKQLLMLKKNWKVQKEFMLLHQNLIHHSKIDHHWYRQIHNNFHKPVSISSHVFSRVHATLHLTVSVGPSVDPSHF